MKSIVLSSSIRSRSIEDSLRIAHTLSVDHGITRVVETTWLDKIGLPVFASIRPNGEKGSLCVHAGKGYHKDEAKIGAYMEAIEFSFASENTTNVNWSISTPKSILESFKNGISFSSFCPRLGKQVQLEEKIAIVEGDEILQGLGEVIVPAELVYHPFTNNPFQELYGTSTNGLASGNDINEATAHGLAELMERHIYSFDCFKDDSLIVDTLKAPKKIRSMIEKIEAAGLKCVLRYSQNDFGLAYFSSYILEPDEYTPLSVSSGYGLHPIAEVAAIRAISEAVQSRSTYIHGGRDDISFRVNTSKKLGVENELKYIRLLRNHVNRDNNKISFDQVPSFVDECKTIQGLLSLLFKRIKHIGVDHLVRVELTPKDYPMTVVKLIAPGCEAYEHKQKRVGKMLMEFVTND